MYSNSDSKTKLYFAGSKWEDEPIMTVQEMSYYLRQILAILRVRPARVQPERTAAAKLVISKWNLPVENEIQLANLEKNLLLKENESEVVRHISYLLFHYELITIFFK